MNSAVPRVHCFCDISHEKAKVTWVGKYTAAIQLPAPNMSGTVINCSMVEVMKLSKSDSDTTMKRCSVFEQRSLRWRFRHCKFTKGLVSRQKKPHSSNLIYCSTVLCYYKAHCKWSADFFGQKAFGTQGLEVLQEPNYSYGHSTPPVSSAPEAPGSLHSSRQLTEDI